jgi:hypothetical protein
VDFGDLEYNSVTLGLWLLWGCLSLTFWASLVLNVLLYCPTCFWFEKHGQCIYGETGWMCCKQTKRSEIRQQRRDAEQAQD